ncbi:hypothetical protein QWA68_016875, partial [Fusarium oxysporum]
TSAAPAAPAAPTAAAAGSHRLDNPVSYVRGSTERLKHDWLPITPPRIPFTLIILILIILILIITFLVMLGEYLMPIPIRSITG